MKKLKAFGLLVVVLALSLAFIACNSGTGGGTGPDTGGGGDDRIPWDWGTSGGSGNKGGSLTAQVLTFTDGEYTVEITENRSRAAYQPKDGDFYVIKKGGVVISSGTVTVKETDTGAVILTFTPTNPPEPGYTFTAVLEGGLLTIEPDNGGKIKGDDGEDYIIPALNDQNNEYGHANSLPVLDAVNRTIAGLKYKGLSEGSQTDTHKGKHYLIDSSFDAAYNLLIAQPGWGNEDENSWESPYVSIYTSGEMAWKLIADKKPVVLFEVNEHSYTNSDGDGSWKDYRLAEWVSDEVTVGEGDYYSGTWRVAIWNSEYYDSVSDIWVERTLPAETPTKIGVLAYTQSEDISYGPTKREWSDYVLDVTYNDALTTLKKLWGDPATGWSFWSSSGDYGEIINQAIPNGAVFGVSKSTDSDGTWYSFVLYKYNAAQKDFLGVGWWYSPGH